MWHWWSDRGVSQSGPPQRKLDICCLWGPATWNYRLNQVLSIFFALLYLLLPLLPLSCLLLYLLYPRNVLYCTSHTFSPPTPLSLTLLFILSHLPFTHPSPFILPSPPLPLGHWEHIQPPVPESYLNLSYVSQPAASAPLKPQGYSDLRSAQGGNAKL